MPTNRRLRDIDGIRLILPMTGNDPNYQYVVGEVDPVFRLAATRSWQRCKPKTS